MSMYKTKVDIVYENLLLGIENGKYAPGERLIISQLAKEYEVSEIPVREAIRRLESEGYIRISANQGAVVFHFTPEQIEEIVSIRAVLEAYATRLACDVLTEKDYKNLRRINQELREASELNRISQLNYEFHMYMYERLPQKELCKMIAELWEKYRITRKIFQFDPDRRQNSCEKHEKIIVLMEQKRHEEVEQFVRTHKLSMQEKIVLKLKDHSYL